MNKHAISWFEVPALDFERAKKFYSQIFDYTMEEMKIENLRIGMLPYENDMSQGNVGGGIVYGEGYVPQRDGVLVYLNAGEDLTKVLDRIPKAGGTILMPKTQITEEIGYFALFVDTEGNRMALFSPK